MRIMYTLRVKAKEKLVHYHENSWVLVEDLSDLNIWIRFYKLKIVLHACRAKWIFLLKIQPKWHSNMQDKSLADPLVMTADLNKSAVWLSFSNNV